MGRFAIHGLRSASWDQPLNFSARLRSPAWKLRFINSTSWLSCSGGDFKPRGPFNVRAVAISNWQHSERRAMIANGNGRADESVGIRALGIGERDENFAKHLTISLCQDADAPDACRISTVLDGARFHERQPVGNCVEAADHRPNLLRWRVHHTADKHLRHSLWAVTAKPQSATPFRVSPE